MRVFVDECVNRRFMRYLIGHAFIHIAETSLLSMKNGALLRAVAPDYEVFLTRDRGIRTQQNLKRFPLAFIILRARSNSLAHLRPLVPELLATLGRLESEGFAPGELHEIAAK